MSRTHFLQRCPTCGRSLEVLVELGGRSVVCQHCGATFVAQGGKLAGPHRAERVEALIQQADELLSQSE